MVEKNTTGPRDQDTLKNNSTTDNVIFALLLKEVMVLISTKSRNKDITYGDR